MVNNKKMTRVIIILLFGITSTNIFCQNIKGIGVWEQLVVKTNKLVNINPCINNTYVIEKKIKSITEMSLHTQSLDTINNVVLTEKYDKMGLLTDFMSEDDEIKYIFDSLTCEYNQVFTKKFRGIREPNGEVGSISGTECICKEYSRKGLLINNSIDQNGFIEKWIYEYLDNDLIKSESYYINGELIYRHGFFYEYY